MAIFLVMSSAEAAVSWRTGTQQARVIAPSLTGPMSGIVVNTFHEYTSGKYDWRFPVEQADSGTALNIVAGNAQDNPLIARLGREGADVRVDHLGEEGFRIVTFENDGKKYILLLAQTPVGLKYACQDLLYFHMPVSRETASVDWPMNITRRPQFAYRGTYILPCWAQHDSVEHWRRVLKFNSEISCNRNYFWLDGFPLLPQYGGEYAGTDLANPANVQSLIELSRQEGMKFLIGGGWDTWHQRKLFNGDIRKSVQYYLDLLHLLPGAEGIYLEPVGEGAERTDPKDSLRSVDAIRDLANTIWRDRPDFEFAIAAGKFNPDAYLKALDAIDRKRIYWTWGWGDPLKDHALAVHPQVLRWHTIVKMSEWHGSNDAPRPDEVSLPGFYTSYDPGMGFGNLWNGRGYGVGTGVPAAREFDPYTIPYFAREYWFRDRAWDVNETRDQFRSRLGRRLFDADMPPEAIDHYLALDGMCQTPRQASESFLTPIERFTTKFAGVGTLRNQDTIRRMQEAISGLREVRPLPEKKSQSGNNQ